MSSGGGRDLDGATFAAVAAVLVLNVLDGAFTVAFLQLGVAEEANPLMRLAYEQSPLGFMLVKLSVVHAGVALLWLGRENPAARRALLGAVVLYAGIIAYHCVLLGALVGT